MQRALAEAYWPEAGSDVVLNFGAGDTRTLRMRVRFTRRRSLQQGQAATEEFCVLLLEDVRTVQARLRQEKLAAMGRVSAGIAHEIRNPLAAIAQANALLLEDALPEPQQRLARMVADNVERLKRIVDEVMEVAPGTAPQPSAIDATAEVAAAAADWARTAGMRLGPGQPAAAGPADEPLRVVVRPRAPAPRAGQPARQRASATAAARPAPSACAWRRATKAARCCWWTATAPPIAPEVERYLFEPFFSTRSRGTGLGLYICRELCERYGASIEYRLRPGRRQRNQFLVIMRRETAPSAEAEPHDTPPDAHDRRPRQQPARRRRRARPAHAVRADAAARGLRRRDRRHASRRPGQLLDERAFSAVITDMRLPDGTGLELLQRLEAAGRAREGASSSPPTARPRTRSRR